MEPQVRPELHQLERYVHDALGVAVKIILWSGTDRLPHFLKERQVFDKHAQPSSAARDIKVLQVSKIVFEM